MSRDRKAIIALAIALFVACIVITCLAGLVLGGAWRAMAGRLTERSPRLIERGFTEHPPEFPGPRTRPTDVGVGALITEVIEGSPASQAGLKPGDMILAVDGERVGAGADLRDMLSAFRPGDRIELTIRRGASERSVQIKLGQRDDDPHLPYLGVTYRLVPTHTD